MADILASTSTTATLAVNGFGGFSSIETAGDQDWWKITLVAGSAYTFRLNALTFGGLSDPLLRLLDASGRQLAFNDDFGGSLNSAINFTATQSGTYFLSAQGYGSSTGNYVISAYTAPVLPVLDIAATSASKAEGTSGSTAFTFTVTRSGSTTGSSTVNWSVAGGTASASDFTGGVLPTGTLSFAAGETSKLITLNVAGDSQIEGDEDFKVVLSEATGATIGTTAAIGTIVNDDALPVVGIAATSASKAEGNSGSTPFTFTITRSGNLTVASTVGWAVAADTASASDFTGGVLPTGSVSFAVGETSKVVTVNVAGELLIEADETFRVNLTTATGATLGTASATGTILNDDILPVISLTTTSVSKAEGNSGSTPFAFTVTRSGNTSGTSYVNWSVDEVSAGLNGDDFTGATNGVLTFTAGQTSKVITVNVAGDTAIEANEIFNLTLTSADGATLGNRIATGTIVNDDTLPTLAIAATSASKAEGAAGATTPFTFTVTRSGNTGIASTVNWAVAAGTASASDFTGGVLPTGSVSFAVGETSKVITVNVAGDALVEANETFTVNLSGASSATIATASATGTIVNDDTLPTLAIAATSASKTEGAAGATTPFTFTVTRSGNTGIASTVNWAVAAGTASASDFTGGVLPTGSVSFAVGETSKVITVNVAGDALVEANETFTVNLSGASGATITTASATGTIVNDDTLPTLAIAATSASKAEGAAGATTPFTFTVTRSGNTGIASTVNWAVAAGTASASDFTGGVLPTGSVSFAVGETSKVITVNVAGDNVFEADETFNVTLSGASGATIATATAAGTILNDDVADIAGDTSSTATLTVDGATAASAIDFSGDQDWFRVNLTAGTSYAFSLDAATTGGLGDAYLRLLSSTGSSLAEDDDSGGGYNSRIVYTATTTGAYFLSAQGYGTSTGNYVLGAVALTQPSLSIVANNTSQAEGNSGSTPFIFTVTRAGNTGVASSVNWAVSGGTATASDFTGGVLPSGTLSFAAGEASKTITVNVAGDTTIESDETFSVVLSGASNATIGTASASCTIVNDDASTSRAGIDRSIATTTSFSVPSTVDPSIDNLVGSIKWGGALGTGTALTYSFSSAASVFTYTNTFNGLDAHSPYTALSSLQQTAAREAMASVAAICNLTFTEVADTTTSAGDIRWTVTQSPNEGTADGYFPSTSAAGGDIWLNSSDYTNPQAGNYAYLTFIHELGHTMGLGHPHTGTPAPEAGEDQLKYSVMSYRSYDGAPLTGYNTSYYPVDYMLNDIAALQYLYGANMSYNSGNNVYSWTAGSRIYDCIWDGGGIDTIDASNQTLGVTLNLNPGTWSSIGTAYSNGSTSVRNDLGIAYGVTIENAKGTALADTLIGNAADNRLFGGGGADTLTGGTGADDFVFVVAGDGGDVISDFSVAEGDAIQVIAGNFGLVAGASAILRTGISLPGAASAAGEFLYNSSNGQLWFDQDGTGSGAAVQLATLTTRPILTAGSIQLVAS